jgi:hypothetical protein
VRDVRRSPDQPPLPEHPEIDHDDPKEDKPASEALRRYRRRHGFSTSSIVVILAAQNPWANNPLLVGGYIGVCDIVDPADAVAIDAA